MQDELVKAMTIGQLKAFKKHHATNETIVKIVDGAIAIKELEILESLRWLPFYDLADATLGTLPDYNPNWRLTDPCQSITIYTVEVDDTSKDMVEVEVEGVKTMRYLKTLQRIVKLGSAIPTVVTTTTPSVSKGGNCYKRQQASADTLIGHFATCAEACTHLDIDAGKGSACAALVTNGYYFTKIE